VAFDLSGGTFRDDMVADYKGGRAATPEDLEHQFDLIRDFCLSLAIPVIGVPGYEADDVLATLASTARDEKIPVVVVTGDRDSFQLVEDPFIRVLYNKRGVSDYELYDEAGIMDRCGVEPQRYPLYAALRGDKSDNLPGVPGVGEKTAAKLLTDYRDFDELFNHLDDLTPKLKSSLAASEDLARNNQAVMTLVRDVPVPVDVATLRLGGWDRDEIFSFFDRFEMAQMRGRYEKLMNEGLFGNSTQSASANSAGASAKAQPTRASALKEVTTDAVVVACAGDRIAVLDVAKNVAWVGPLEEFFKSASKSQLVLGGFDVKNLYRRGPQDKPLAPPSDDGSIMAFLLDSIGGDYSLAGVARRYLGEDVPGQGGTLFDETTDDDLVTTVALIERLNDRLRQEIATWELDYVYRSIELPLVAVLGWMEARGIYVDRALLERTAKEFADEVTTLDAKIQALAGHEFKVNSPAQLQKVLFDEMGLKPGKKTKTGYSTDAGTLEAIAQEHEIIPLILRFRELDKLRGTYGQSLIDTVGADSRIHATFQQTVARTGRISSDSPNLHNIPVRTVEGRKLRFAFGPEPGWRLLVADYNQIELRVIAHLSQDPGLLDAFHSGQDIHRQIAAIVFHIDADDVTHQQREFAKAVSYGLAYGMESFGLSQRLGISVGEAKDVIDQYFNGFPALRGYMDQTIAQTRQQGFSRTLFGRIRPFPDLATAVGPQRQAAERQAMNAGIQGLAADIFKLGLGRVDAALRRDKLTARLVLQVHDEVLVEAPPAEVDQVERIVRHELTTAAELSVPLTVEVHWGDNWAQAKG
jgi:DNA polymerase-1